MMYSICVIKLYWFTYVLNLLLEMCNIIYFQHFYEVRFFEERTFLLEMLNMFLVLTFNVASKSCKI